MFECRNLCKSYNRQPIVQNIQFALPAGQCIGILGENGCGKSTLLRLLAQIEPPDSGDILYHGQSVLGDRRFLRSRLGYVPQELALQPELTVRQQLRLWRSACGLDDAIPPALLELMGLEPILRQKIGKLSGGTCRRVSIAMALSGSPEILVMDEATTGLDQAYRDRLLDWLEVFMDKGGRIIWCSHHKDEIDRLCGGRIYLQSGREPTYSREETSI